MSFIIWQICHLICLHLVRWAQNIKSVIWYKKASATFGLIEACFTWLTSVHVSQMEQNSPSPVDIIATPWYTYPPIAHPIIISFPCRHKGSLPSPSFQFKKGILNYCLIITITTLAEQEARRILFAILLLLFFLHQHFHFPGSLIRNFNLLQKNTAVFDIKLKYANKHCWVNQNHRVSDNLIGEDFWPVRNTKKKWKKEERRQQQADMKSGA